MSDQQQKLVATAATCSAVPVAYKLCSKFPSIRTCIYWSICLAGLTVVGLVGMWMKEGYYLLQYEKLTAWSQSEYPLAKFIIDYLSFSNPLQRTWPYESTKMASAQGWKESVRCAIGKPKHLYRNANHWVTKNALEFGKHQNKELLDSENQLYGVSPSGSSEADFTSSKRLLRRLWEDVEMRLKKDSCLGKVDVMLPMIATLLMRFDIHRPLVNWIRDGLNAEPSAVEHALLFVLLSGSIAPSDDVFELVEKVPAWKPVILIDVAVRAFRNDLLKSAKFTYNTEVAKLFRILSICKDEKFEEKPVDKFIQFLSEKALEIQAILVTLYVRHNWDKENIENLVKPFVQSKVAHIMIPLFIQFASLPEDAIKRLRKVFAIPTSDSGPGLFTLVTPIWTVNTIYNFQISAYEPFRLIPIWNDVWLGKCRVLPGDVFADIFKRSSDVNICSTVFSIVFSLLVTDMHLLKTIEFPHVSNGWLNKKVSIDYFYNSLSATQYHLFHWLLKEVQHTAVLNGLIEARQNKLNAIRNLLEKNNQNGQSERHINQKQLPDNFQVKALKFLSNIKKSKQSHNPGVMKTQMSVKNKVVRAEVLQMGEGNGLGLSSYAQFMKAHIDNKPSQSFSFSLVAQFMKGKHYPSVIYAKDTSRVQSSHNVFTSQLQDLIELVLHLSKTELQYYMDNGLYFFLERFCVYFKLDIIEDASSIKNKPIGKWESLKNMLSSGKRSSYSQMCFYGGRNTDEFLVTLSQLVKDSLEYKWYSWRAISSALKTPLAMLFSRPNLKFLKLSSYINNCPGCMEPYLVYMLYDPLVIQNEDCIMMVLKRITSMNGDINALCLALIASVYWPKEFYDAKDHLVCSFVKRFSVGKNENVQFMTTALLVYNMCYEINTAAEFEYVYIPILEIMPLDTLQYLYNLCNKGPYDNGFCVVLQNAIYELDALE